MKQTRVAAFISGIGLVMAAIAAAGCPALDWSFQGTGGAGAGGAGGASSASSATSGSSPGSAVAVASSSGISAAVASSSSGGMGPPSWNLYSFDMAAAKWSTVALNKVWTDPNAPPVTGILAATHLVHFNKLLVFADNGMFYLQDSGVWSPPVPTSARFPQIVNPAALNTLFHVSSDWNVTPMQMPLKEGLTFLENPEAYVYDSFADNTVQFVTKVTVTDELPPGPKQATGKALWTFEIWNKTQIGGADGYAIWTGYDDGYVYKLGADSSWSKYAPASGPLWAGQPGAPPWATLQASYFIGNPSNGIGTIYFIGP